MVQMGTLTLAGSVGCGRGRAGGIQEYRYSETIFPGRYPWNMGSLLRAGSYAAANLAGIGIIQWISVSSASIYGAMEGTAVTQWMERITAAGNALKEITSLDYIQQGDYSRLIAVVIIWMIGLAAAAAVIWILRIHREENGLELCWLLCLTGIVGVLLATVLLRVTLRSIYVFMWFPLVAFSGLIVIRKLPGVVKYGVVGITCALSLASLAYCYMPYATSLLHSEPSDSELASQWIQNNGYQYVYGDYWGAATQIAHHSNGDLEAGCWHTVGNIFRVEMSNTPQDIYGAAENEKAVYVFTAAEEESARDAAQQRNVRMEKVAEFGEYRIYISPVPLMQTQ